MEQLIEELVDPRSRLTPQRIEEVQREIQRLQREPTGWQLGLALLKKSNSHFRFYGALTLTIKLRTDCAFIDVQEALREAVLTDLIACYVSFTNESEQQFVLRKVSSTLAAFFLQPNSSWQLPVRHLLASLCGLQIWEHESINDFHKIWASIQHISSSQLRSVLWLSSSLVEEVTKLDVKGPESATLVAKVAGNAPDVWYLIYLILRSLHSRYGNLESQASSLPDYLSSSAESEVIELSKEALDTASTWIHFQSSLPSEDDSTSDVTKATVLLILQCFSISDVADNAILCLTGIAQQAPKYLRKAGLENLDTVLTSQQAELHMTNLLQGAFEAESVHFAVFVVTLLDLYDLSSPETFQDKTVGILLAVLRTLLYTPGTAVVVDQVCQNVLDAFNQIADRWSDWVGSSAVDESLKPLVHEACKQYAVKIQYPPHASGNASSSWESDERAQFQDFRNDVQDLLLASYACLGPSLVENLTIPLRSSNSSSGWEEFEAHLYCLGALADVISNNTTELGRHVSGVLSSYRWSVLMQNGEVTPDLARQGAINFIARNTFILQQDSQHLLPCVNFLFASLRLPGSSTSASRAISLLCHKQRSMLVEAVPQFINSLSTLTEIPPDERHRLFGAVAAIVQAIHTERGKVDPLVQMFSLISQFSGSALVSPGDDGLISAVDLLQTLATVGKGLRAPPEESIDLDAEPNVEELSFWTSGGGKDVQQNIQSVIDQSLVKYGDEPLLIEATCDILKSGYTENHPSPFKFNPKYSASFLTQNIRLNSPRTSLILDTASSFLASYASQPDIISQELYQISSTIIWHQRTLLDTFAASKTYDDHEFTHSSLEYFTRTLPKYGYYFFDKSNAEAWQVLFEFALLALENPDTLPRRCAAQFWAAIFEHTPTLPPPSSTNLTTCIQHYGPRFTSLLLRLLSGGAARSELDVLCEPLKKLVARQGVLGARLLRDGAGGFGDGFGGRVRRFVEQVIVLKGGRKTTTAVREFWIGGRGEAYHYA